MILREQQYASKNNDEVSLEIAKNCIIGKVYNARWVLERAVRDHGFQIDVERVKSASAFLKDGLERIRKLSLKNSSEDMKEKLRVSILACLMSLSFSRRRILYSEGEINVRPLTM